MAVKNFTLANEYEILLQMIELAHQSYDTNLIIYTYHYASQYYRHVHQPKEAADFLRRALNLCTSEHPLKPQLQEELDSITFLPTDELNSYWIFAKTGLLLFQSDENLNVKVDSDLFGMFFAALQQFASECGAMGDQNIKSIQWTNGSEFLIYHRIQDPIFIVGISPNHDQSPAINNFLRRIYHRFMLMYEIELINFQGNVEIFQTFLD